MKCLPQFVLLCLVNGAIIASPLGVTKAVSSVGSYLTFKIQPEPELAGAPPKGTAAAPFVLKAHSQLELDRAVGCLGDAVYYEAGFEPTIGQRAVAQVVLNRVRDPSFPKTVCEVVYQGAERGRGCQFSFACDGSKARRRPSPGQLAQARTIARQALEGFVVPEVGTATHYHTVWSSPWWKGSVKKVTRIGGHEFYRWRGTIGAAAAHRIWAPEQASS